MKNKIKRFLIPLLVILAISCFPVVFLYLKNIGEVGVGEVYLAILFSGLLGAIVYSSTYLLIKKENTSAIISIIFIAVFANYTIMEKGVLLLFNGLKYWHILPVLLFLSIHLAYLININVKESASKIIISSIGISVVVLLAFNIINASPKIIAAINSQMVLNKETGKENVKAAGKPNFYYMIFDEYAGFTVADKYYGYSNEKFKKFLNSSGFTVSEESHNESGNTVSVLTNCLNLEYVVSSGMDTLETEKYLKNPKLFNVFKERGYEIKGVGDTSWLNVESVNSASEQGSQTIEGLDFNQLVINNTFLYPFFTYSGTKAAKLILDTFEYMQTPGNITPDNSELILLYLCTPHQPFLFDEKGKAVEPQNYNNWTNDKYYLNQYIFVTREIQKTVQMIVEKDPNAVILLSSDHGPRFKGEISYGDKLNVLNALYYKGEQIEEIGGQSIVNTLRIIINRMFSLDYPLVEVTDGTK